MSALDRIETERLICERERAEHADDLCVVMRDPEVLRTTWFEPGPPTRAHVVDKLAADIAHRERYGFGP